IAKPLPEKRKRKENTSASREAADSTVTCGCGSSHWNPAKDFLSLIRSKGDQCPANLFRLPKKESKKPWIAVLWRITHSPILKSPYSMDRTMTWTHPKRHLKLPDQWRSRKRQKMPNR